MARIVD